MKLIDKKSLKQLKHEVAKAKAAMVKAFAEFREADAARDKADAAYAKADIAREKAEAALARAKAEAKARRKGRVR